MDNDTTKQNILITGATGMVGSEVLKMLLTDDRVSKVVSLGRRVSGLVHDKLEELTVESFVDLSGVSGELSGIDICFYCLGVYQNQVDKDTFFEITCTYQKNLTDILQEESPEANFVLFSASGADPSGRSPITFSKAKGQAECLLWETSFPRKYVFRPAHIHPVGERRPKGLSYKLMTPVMGKLMELFPNFGSTARELAQSMVSIGLDGQTTSGIFESEDIRWMIRADFPVPFSSRRFPVKATLRSPQTALVTGASSGMGKDFAQALAEQGYKVYAVARRYEKMEDLKELGVTPIRMDITCEEDIESVVQRIEDETGGVDILVNNAGFGMNGAVEDISIDDARYQFEVNLFGLARLTQLVLPGMRESGAGKVINISSIGGKIYSPLGAWYHATKHALEGWSDCLRLEVEQYGIDVVIIEPGAIRTEFGDVMTGPMMERSGRGPYARMALELKEMHKKEYEQGGGSEASVITELVLEAVQSERPKTRYAAGKYSGLMLFARKWLSDRTFDRLIMMMVR